MVTAVHRRDQRMPPSCCAGEFYAIYAADFEIKKKNRGRGRGYAPKIWWGESRCICQILSPKIRSIYCDNYRDSAKPIAKLIVYFVRASLRHVRGVRPNRAADFRGPPFWTIQCSKMRLRSGRGELIALPQTPWLVLRGQLQLKLYAIATF